MRSTEIRKGMLIIMDGDNHLVLDVNHVMPGKGPAYIQTKLRNLRTGSTLEKRIRSAENVESVYVERKTMMYSYSDNNGHYFMDPTTYEQVLLGPDLIGNAMDYLLPNTDVTLLLMESKAVSLEIPTTMDLEVKDTPPQLKGATVTNQYKIATLETGIEVQVPPFIVTGERIRVDTRSGKYIERAK